MRNCMTILQRGTFISSSIDRPWVNHLTFEDREYRRSCLRYLLSNISSVNKNIYLKVPYENVSIIKYKMAKVSSFLQFFSIIRLSLGITFEWYLFLSWTSKTLLDISYINTCYFKNYLWYVHYLCSIQYL